MLDRILRGYDCSTRILTVSCVRRHVAVLAMLVAYSDTAQGVVYGGSGAAYGRRSSDSSVILPSSRPAVCGQLGWPVVNEVGTPSFTRQQRGGEYPRTCRLP